MMAIGEVQSDNSIRLYDRNINYRDYRRIRPSPDQKLKLASWGLQWVSSSNVSGVGINGDDLYIRFLNASLYKYPNQAELFDKIMKANSKGKAVWKYLRRTNVPYERVGSLPFDNQEVIESDEDMFDNLSYEASQILTIAALAQIKTLNDIVEIASIKDVIKTLT